MTTALEEANYRYPAELPHNRHFETQMQRREAFERGAEWQARQDAERDITRGDDYHYGTLDGFEQGTTLITEARIVSVSLDSQPNAWGEIVTTSPDMPPGKDN